MSGSVQGIETRFSMCVNYSFTDNRLIIYLIGFKMNRQRARIFLLMMVMCIMLPQLNIASGTESFMYDDVVPQLFYVLS